MQDTFYLGGRRVPVAQFLTPDDHARAARMEARGLGCAEVYLADLLIARVTRLVEAGK